MNDRMKKLFEECSQLAKDKNINIVLPTSGGPSKLMVDGIEYLDGGTVKANVIKGRTVGGSFQFKFEPGSPMAKLKEMNVPHEAFQEFRLGAVAGLVNHGIPIDEQLKSLVERIEAANGNWTKFIRTPSEITPIYNEHFELTLTKAVYNALAQSYSATMSFRLTIASKELIKEITEQYLKKNKAQVEVTGCGVYVHYDTVKELGKDITNDKPFNPDDLVFTIIPGSTIKLS
ncbi:hypothetical protein N1M2_136 [Klebsiella phage N1M2]|uniref:Uncharacterized protein n=1 Tax=Klebsiella phage N1M2 TaxID=2664939 RepID=A0A6B7ZF86_9CAUD|nr:hypothetical protein PQB72_gp136 [Klebsiella phage N1M2]QGH71999.1 hypothetical protein N1M2_136 [Klebsiella phage N1M2]